MICTLCGASIAIAPSPERPCPRCTAIGPAATGPQGTPDVVLQFAVQRRIASAIENCAEALITISKSLAARSS
jgi:hypothetical protein